jgi:hypothetical protein
MKTTVNQSAFMDAFHAHDRYEQFGYAALSSLFDYLEQYEENTNKEIELDVIALCCDYSVDTVKDIASNYSIDIEGKPRYVAGCNMPGYLPDSDPAEFDDEDDALEYIKEVAKEAADADNESDDFYASNQNALNEACDADRKTIDAWDTDKNGEFGRTIGKYHYWISRDGNFPMDADEARDAVVEYLNENTTVIDSDCDGKILYCSAF